jgi:hypothetical protein
MPKEPKPASSDVSTQKHDLDKIKLVDRRQSACETLPLEVREEVSAHLTAAYRKLEDAGYGSSIIRPQLHGHPLKRGSSSKPKPGTLAAMNGNANGNGKRA